MTIYRVACYKCKTVKSRETHKKFLCTQCKNKWALPLGWKVLRRRILKERGFCEICKRKEKLLVHHIDKNRRNNMEENLKVLCNQCHLSMHRSEGKKLVNVNYEMHGVRLLWA